MKWGAAGVAAPHHQIRLVRLLLGADDDAATVDRLVHAVVVDNRFETRPVLGPELDPERVRVVVAGPQADVGCLELESRGFLNRPGSSGASTIPRPVHPVAMFCIVFCSVWNK